MKRRIQLRTCAVEDRGHWWALLEIVEVGRPTQQMYCQDPMESEEVAAMAAEIAAERYVAMLARKGARRVGGALTLHQGGRA